MGRAAPAAGAFLIGGLLVVGLSAVSQQPSSPPQPIPPGDRPPQEQRPPTFRTGADLVRVDVTVLDRRGLPVTSLNADDFEIQEDEVPQAVTSFKLVEVNGHPPPGEEFSLPIRSREHAAAEAARDDVRVFLIFWDEYHIDRMGSSLRAREHLERFVRTAFGPTDLVAFMDPLTPVDAIKFTRDRTELVETVKRLQGRLGIYSPARSAMEEGHMYARDIERLRSEISLSAIKAASAFLGTLREGRKSIILVTEGMRGLGRDQPTIISDLMRTANDSNTAIYAIDPRGLMLRGRQSDYMTALADSTGAEAYQTNALDQALTRVVTQAQAYYLLGYDASQRPKDGRFHKIKVRVKPPGLDVRARSGYWAPSVADMVRASREAAESALPPDIEQALSELTPTGHRGRIDLWFGTGLSAGGRPEVRAAWRPRDAFAGEAEPGPLSVTVVATRDTQEIVAGALPAAGLSFEADPGPLHIDITVSGADGEPIDRDVRTVNVPDPSADLWIDTPIVLRVQNALERRAITNRPSPAPFAGREFGRGDQVLIRFAVLGPLAPDATIAAALMTRRGATLVDLPVTPVAALEAPGQTPAGVLRYGLEFPVGNIGRGEYLVGVTATSGSSRARALVPLRIR